MEEQDVLDRIIEVENYARELQSQIDVMRGILENMQKPVEELIDTRLKSLEQNTQERALAKLNDVLSRVEAKFLTDVPHEEVVNQQNHETEHINHQNSQDDS